MICAPSKDSDQPRHPPSLIRAFDIHMKKHWVSSYPVSTLRRRWSDWANDQADLSLCLVQSFCWFCHEAAQIIRVCNSKKMVPLFKCTPLYFQENSTDEAKVDGSLSLRPEPSPGSVSSRSTTPASVSGKMFYHFYVSLVMRKHVFALCEKQRCRSACTSTQSDQHLCCSLPR